MTQGYIESVLKELRMKRIFILSAAVMLLAGTFAFAEEDVLIDFTKLSADCIQDEKGNYTQNKHTVMDYSVAAGATFDDNQKALMLTSLALTEWEVKLNSSAKTVNAIAVSTVVAAPVKTQKKDSTGKDVDVTVPFKGSNVMGVRVLFPTWTANANAKIVPPYEIQAYEPATPDADENGKRTAYKDLSDDEKKQYSGKYLFEDGYGLIKNVGTIKSISVTTMGMNFPHGLFVLLKDNDNVERRYFMGYLNFDGWKTLIWNNPDYITEVRTREIRIYPIYPRGTPYVKFAGFQITRDSRDIGEDFIGYFKDVKVIYDLAVLTADRDIDDENIWQIITKKEEARQTNEMSRFGNTQVNRYIEKEKMAAEDESFKTDDYLEQNNKQNGNTTDAPAK